MKTFREYLNEGKIDLKVITAYLKKIGIYGENISVKGNEVKVEFSSNTDANEVESLINASSNVDAISDYNISKNVVIFDIEISEL